MYQVVVNTINNVEQAQVLALFEHFQHSEWAVYLDSCGQHDIGARYDIIAHSPVLKYEYKAKTSKLTGDWLNKGFSLNANANDVDGNQAFSQVASLQQQFNQLFDYDELKKLDIPFVIGAISAIAYDLNASMTKVSDSDPAQFALPDLSVGFYASSVIYDNRDKILYCCSYDQDYFKQIQQLLAQTKTQADSFALTSEWQKNTSKQAYLDSMQDIHEYILSGDCYQINFAQRFSARYSGSEWTAYKILRQHNNAPFSCFMRLPTSCLLSVSPERFLRVKDGFVQSKPIKGTRERGKTKQQDEALAQELLSAEKDKAENLMIVDLLRNDLSKVCKANSVRVPHLFALESYPAVHHMVSTVEGELKQTNNVYDLLAGAFPGGSITGAPKLRAMQIIQQLEHSKRSIYCGSIGYVGIRNDMDTNICIRTLLAEQQTLHCWAGGGIVYDSDAHDEYNETLHKVAKILPILEKVR